MTIWQRYVYWEHVDNFFFSFRHGLGRTDFYILNDPELSFREIVNKNVMSVVSGTGFKTDLPSIPIAPSIKPEKSENEVVRVDQNQIVVTLEKGEGTLQIEKIGVKKEPAEEQAGAETTVKTEPEDTQTDEATVKDKDAVVKSEQDTEEETKSEEKISEEKDDKSESTVKESDAKETVSMEVEGEIKKKKIEINFKLSAIGENTYFLDRKLCSFIRLVYE